ncbi:diguanylate cyclase domain-containing protein [Yoonia sp. SS1-5]|uniref:diguanylate cyclase n=1 Tax=Yoonia rhodophyticola TaxID=3137370 RepID=A0AAN0MC81_9RHOB
MALLKTILGFAEPIGLAILLVYAYGFVRRSVGSYRQVCMMMGLVFGLTSLAGMMSPVEMSEGIFVDMRNLFIGVAAAFFGVIAGVITLVMAATARFYMGGIGVLPGIMGMGVAVVAGLTWKVWVRPRLTGKAMPYLVLGLMISAHLAVAFVLPAAMRNKFLIELAPILLVANLVGALLLGKLIRREEILADETIRLLSAAQRDHLTGLLNREAALTRYEALSISARPDTGLAMLCIDVDSFKAINDTHGHLRGDQVLVEIAERMNALLRPTDMFARMSGDEFLIVVTDLTREQASAIADRCQKSVSETPAMCDGAQIDLSVSIGCTWAEEKPAFAELRDCADQALYNAKERGRNCVAHRALPVTQGLSVARPAVA